MKKADRTNILKRVLGIFLIAIFTIAYLPICSEDDVNNGFTAYATSYKTMECGKTYTITMDYDKQTEDGYIDEEGDLIESYVTYRFFPKEDVVYKVTAKYVSGYGVCDAEFYTDESLDYPTPLVFTHISKEQRSDSREGKFLVGPDYDYYFTFAMMHHEPMDEGYDEDRDWDPDPENDYLNGKKLTIEFRIEPAKKEANPIKIKGKTVTIKRAKLKKKNQTISCKKAFKITDKQGKVTFKKVKGNKKITVSSSGKITVKKGLKKGTYKVKVKYTAAATAYYKKKVKTTTVTIKVN